MDISIKAKVDCVDGHYGHIAYLILNPTTDQVTHVVVATNLFPESAHLVPIEKVVECQPDRVCLSISRAELDQSEPFIEADFLGVGADDPDEDTFMVWPYAEVDAGMVVVEHKRIPQGEVEVHRGARVVATDGVVGQVDAFLIDPKSGKTTHLLLRKGHLWGQKDITIAVSEIERIEHNHVFLRLDKRAIAALPAVNARSRRQTS
jgi:sporulation protein YlmC with PRC-barrel domain